MIEVVLLGTGGMMPLPDRWLSSLLVRAEGDLVLFDCGEGTQIVWRKVGWNFRRLGAICISHTHADHIAGLPGLLHAVANSGRTEPVTLYGPRGTGEVVRGLRTIAPFLPFLLRVEELSDGEELQLPGNLTGRSAAGEHGLPVLAYRVEQPRRPAFIPARAEALGVPVQLWRRLQEGETATWDGGVATPDEVLGPPRTGLAVGYVTDTRPSQALTELVAGVDLLVCEGTYGNDEDLPKAVENFHMTFREAATVACKANAKRLWITHFSPALENPVEFTSAATSVFPEATIGFDGLTAVLTFAEQ